MLPSPRGSTTLLDLPRASVPAPRREAGRAPARKAPPMRPSSAARALFRAVCFRIPERSAPSGRLIPPPPIRRPPCRYRSGVISPVSYLRIDVEKSRETRLELLLNLVFATLENVHGDTSILPIFQLDRGRAHLRHLVGGQQTQTVHQSQVCHPTIVSQRMRGRLRGGEGRIKFKQLCGTQPYPGGHCSERPPIRCTCR